MDINTFRIGDNVVYPSHGVGEIVARETRVISNNETQLYVIFFQKDKMTIRVPVSRALKDGLRHIEPSDTFMRTVLEVLKHKSETARIPWNKRIQDYEAKVNSGKIDLITKVLRELHKNSDGTVTQSYGEKVMYGIAMERLAQECSLSMSISKEDAINKITAALNYFET